MWTYHCKQVIRRNIMIKEMTAQQEFEAALENDDIVLMTCHHIDDGGVQLTAVLD